MSRMNEPGRIVVIGVGGAGNITVNDLMEHPVAGVDGVNVNTDVQGLQRSLAPHNIQLGHSGFGTNGRPERARRAAMQSEPALQCAMEGAEMVIVTAGLGGGTGTGASPEIARIAKNLGLLTVGIVTLPFAWEGSRRLGAARAGLVELQKQTDALIAIPFESLLQRIDKDASLEDVFNSIFDYTRRAISSFADPSPWSENLQYRTRVAIELLLITADGNLHFKHATLGFAYATLDDLARDTLLLHTKDGNATLSFASVDALLWAGWVLD